MSRFNKLPSVCANTKRIVILFFFNAENAVVQNNLFAFLSETMFKMSSSDSVELK